MRPAVIAHRGNSKYFLENSFEAIFSAIHNRVEYIEIDLRQTKDNHIIVFHDENLKRIFNQKGVISRLSYNDIITQCEDDVQILNLDYVVKLIAGKAKIFFEIKSTCDELLVIDKLKPLDYDSYIVGSFDIEKLKNIREKNRFVNLCHIMLMPKPEQIPILHEYNIKYVSILDSFFFNQKIHDRYRDGNINDFVFTVNSTKRFNKYINMGVFGIKTDVPLDLLDYYKELDENPELLHGRIKNITKKIGTAVSTIKHITGRQQ